MAKRKSARNDRATKKFLDKHPEGRKKFALKKRLIRVKKNQPTNLKVINQLEKLNAKEH